MVHCKWVFAPINTGSESSAYPVVGGDGTVYVGMGNSIYALNPATGTHPAQTLWTYATTNCIQASPLIGPVTERPGHPVRAVARSQPLRHLEPARDPT